MAVYDTDATGVETILDGAQTEQETQDYFLQALSAAGLFNPTADIATVTASPLSLQTDTLDGVILTPGATTVVLDSGVPPGDGVVLAGTAGDDTVVSFATSGNYILGGGSDYLYDAGDGASTVLAGAGNDLLTNAGDGSDTIDAGAGDDTVFDSGAGSSFIGGGDGSDTIFAGIGGDSVDGGAGADTIVIYSGSAYVTGGDGDDFIYDQGTGSSLIYGGTGADTIYAGYGSDTIDGGSGDDLISIFGDASSDTVVGGDGFDTLVILRATSELVSSVTDLSGTTIVTFTDASTLTYSGVESVHFAS